MTSATGIPVTLDPLFVDVYPGDGRKDWKMFCAAGAPWRGAVFKASQGTYYRSDWFPEQRRAFIDAAGDLYGEELWDGAYHYLDLSVSGESQADYFMREVERAGGEKIGTLWAMVDVERGGQRVKRFTLSMVEDCTFAFAERYRKLSGRQATLYGGELLRELGVHDRMGCGRSAIALYGASLPGHVITRTGTDLEHLLFWQYVGADERTPTPAGYPSVAPGCGKVDISALVMPGGIERLKASLWAERPAP